ncbi:cytochrome ubiquinol oxidase subunit I [Magnetospirillum aberrantis]|uniref:Cytochrome bd-I ubiquinol oxidase subunit CydA n=1 Tax=Magnetospirillum aberrantis SpK TaxID=908842 RepID=A0A7C9QSI8_9PROT|nr:cytochrome ubiquinol oxidase subunit I [Magnetospirillum aberrantis]NFV79424.1 cytochrome bd-I ubiquinol oxidase subunit CydA [Magnetospirillum aberrantis SpK]
MFDIDPTQVGRLQFAATALYHFLFVPLTLGLSFLLAIMESVYVMSGRTIWRDMTKFWGKLFGINFAMGVATGITMEFQFGTNWAYYSHYVGDIFGAPLAIEGLMAFFLESTFVGLFFFGWNRMSKVGHLSATWLVAIGSNMSALWILIANGWMQNPVGATFNPDTMRMEMSSFWELLFNPAAQSKFVHTISAGYVTGSIFVMAISAWYLLKNRHVQFARRSMIVASAFGLLSSLSVVVLGDESGYTVSESQKMKLAAMEGMWETEAAPAGFTVFAIPDSKTGENHYEIKVPWVLGLIATRSVDQPVPGINELLIQAEQRVRNGLVAYDALERLRADRSDVEARQTLAATDKDLGHALLLKKYVADPRQADDATIARAARDTLPGVGPLFWSFRLMVALGFFFIAFFAVAFWKACKRDFTSTRFLKLCLWSLPLPWIAAELGWFVAEFGRQPWAVDGMLPTFLASSSLSLPKVLFTLGGFVLFYSSLLVVDIVLMRKTVRLGPVEALGLKAPAPLAGAAPQPAE